MQCSTDTKVLTTNEQQHLVEEIEENEGLFVFSKHPNKLDNKCTVHHIVVFSRASTHIVLHEEFRRAAEA